MQRREMPLPLHHHLFLDVFVWYTGGTTVQRREMEQITNYIRAQQEEYEAMELRSMQKRGRLPMESVSNTYWNVQYSSLNAAASCDQAEEGRHLKQAHDATLMRANTWSPASMWLRVTGIQSQVSPVRLHVPDCGQISGGLRFGATTPNLIMQVPAPDLKFSGAMSESPLNIWVWVTVLECSWESVPAVSCSSQVPNSICTCNRNYHGSKFNPQLMTLNALLVLSY